MPGPDAGVELQIGGVWTDITHDVLDGSAIRITRGRLDEGRPTDPGSGDLVLKNQAGTYSNRNPNSPNFGLLGRNTPIRYTVATGQTALYVPHDVPGRAATPDHASLSITGDIDIRVDLAPASWAGADPLAFETISKYLTTGNQRSWRILVTSQKKIAFGWSTTGADLAEWVTTASVPFGPEERGAIRVTLDADNGAGGYTLTAYTADTIAGPWTQIEQLVTTSGTTSIFSSSAPVEVGDLTTQTFANMGRRIYAAEVRSGINGTVVAAPDFTAQAPGAPSFADSAGRTWTVADGANITDRRILAVHEVPSWPVRWHVSGHNVTAPIQSAGVLRRLGQGRKALDSTLRRRIPSDPNLIAYWPLEEGERATQAYSTIPTVLPMAVTGVDWAADSSLDGSSPLPRLRNPATINALVPRSETQGWQVEFVYHLPALPAAQTEIFRVYLAGSVLRTAIVYASTAGIRIEARDYDEAVLAAFTFSSSLALADFWGVWNRLQIYTVDEGAGVTRLVVAWRDVAAGGGYWQGYTTVTGTMGTVVQLRQSAWAAATEGMTIGHIAVFGVPGTYVGTLNTPGSSIFDGADDGFAGETALNRLDRLANEESSTVTLVAVDGDTTRNSAAMGAQRPRALLDLLQEPADTDGGVLYEDTQRLGLVYRDRASLENQRVKLILDYALLGPPFEPVEDDRRLRNDVTVHREGGSSGQAVDEAGPLGVASVGLYDEALTLSMGADHQAPQIAGWRLHHGTWDEARYPTVRIMLHKHPQLAPAVTSLVIGDRIRITNLPDHQPPGPVDLIVQRITHDIRTLTWDVTLTCSPAGPWTVGTIPPSEPGTGEPGGPGRLDTDGSELASSATSTATTLSVAVTAGPRWMTAAPNAVPEFIFEAGVGSWVCTRGASIGEVTQETVIVHPGHKGLMAARLTRVHATDTGTLNMSDHIQHPAAAGQQWAASVWVYNPGGNGTPSMRVGIAARDGAGTDTITFGSAPAAPIGVWSRLTASATLPAGTVSARITVEGRSGWTQGQYWVMVLPRLARVDGVDDTYEGDMPFEVILGGERVLVHGITGTTSPQTMHVVRSRNGIVKAHSSGADVRLADPIYLAL
ncbi:hypothetical protein ACH44C_33640 [Streptomyces purpureus]|uniref:hypothetical protein n=1 Tax=Streptomyces purpureus TaxID=1951 RepID=UPI0037BA4B52